MNQDGKHDQLGKTLSRVFAVELWENCDKQDPIPGADYRPIKCKHLSQVIRQRKSTTARMKSHLEKCHTDLPTQITNKEIARKRKNALETEELASAVKEAEEYKRQRDMYNSTQDTSLQPHTKKRKLMTEDSSMKPISSYMELKLPLFD